MIDLSNLQRYNAVRNQYKGYTIIHPLMRGGIIPGEVQERLIDEEWTRIGYALCFDCIKGRSDLISNPPVNDFLDDVAKFFGGDVAEHSFGCRGAQFAVMKMIADSAGGQGSEEYSKTVLVDSLCHYTTLIAAEMNNLRPVEVPNNGSPEYKISADGFVEKIEAIKRETRQLPGLIALTHVEPQYGNINPAKEVGRIAKEYNIPYTINVAYSGGIIPINMKDLQADFLTISAHKSMASLGPLGFIVSNSDWENKIFRKSSLKTDWSGRTFDKKILNIFGCSIGGIPLISSMYSFPHVVERVKRWDEELEKTRWFIDEMEKINGIRLIGERPHNHHLLHFETPIFWEISKKHKRRGFFLADEMVEQGIVGLQRGLSKHIKLSVYGLTWDEIRKVRDAFVSIVEKHSGES